jgi:hypothetical protein
VSKLLAAPLRGQSASRAVCPLSYKAVVQDHSVRYTHRWSRNVREALTGDREDACSISAVGDNGVFSGSCRDAVSGAVREEVCACLFVVRSYLYWITAVLVRLAALPDTLLSTYETNPGSLGTFLPTPVQIIIPSEWLDSIPAVRCAQKR